MAAHFLLRSYAVEHGPQVAPSKVAEKKEVGI
jgi:hypothetical protein